MSERWEFITSFNRLYPGNVMGWATIWQCRVCGGRIQLGDKRPMGDWPPCPDCRLQAAAVGAEVDR